MDTKMMALSPDVHAELTKQARKTGRTMRDIAHTILRKSLGIKAKLMAPAVGRQR